MTIEDKPVPVSIKLMIKPIAVVVGIITATAGVVHIADEFRTALDANTKAITMLTDRIVQVDESKWSQVDHDQWVEVLFALNPDLKRPPKTPKDLRK